MLAVKALHQIKATIRYVVKGERAIFYASEREKSYWPGDDHEVPITDLRCLADFPSIERNGFTMLREPTAVRDHQDAGEIEQVLYPEAIGLAKRLNGAAHAIAFGPVARSDSPDYSASRLPAFNADSVTGRPAKPRTAFTMTSALAASDERPSSPTTMSTSAPTSSARVSR